MRVEINGEARDIEEGATIGSLLANLGLVGRPVAVERNTQIVPRAEHGQTTLQEGDKLELVQFVGGG